MMGCVCVLGTIGKVRDPVAHRSTVIDVVTYANGNGRRISRGGGAGVLSPAGVSCSKVIRSEVVLVIDLVEACTVPLEDEKRVQEIVGIRTAIIQWRKGQNLVSAVGDPSGERIGKERVAR